MSMRRPSSLCWASIASGLLVLTTTQLYAQFGGPARVFVATAEQREVATGQTFVGTVGPTRASVVGSAVSGRVQEFLVNEGDRVKKGQPIVKLRTAIIEAEVGAAKAELAFRQAEVLELENGARPEEIEEAKGRLASVEAMLEMWRLRRQRLLASGRSTTQDELENAMGFLTQAEGQLLERKASLKLLEAGPRKEKIAQARAKAAAAEQEAKRLEEQLNRHTMFAPFDGFVSKEFTEEGQWVLQGATLAEIIELDEVDVEVGVLEDYVTHLRVGTTARVEITALNNEVFTGKVAAIVPRANERSRTFPVKIRVANRIDGKNVLIKAGMFARVTLPVGKPEKVTLVPKDSIVLGGPTPMVYVVDADPMDATKGKARPVPVELGIAEGNLVQVRGDVPPRTRVVVQGNERLRPGQDLIIAKEVGNKN